ncbi:uncharacterized protein LOC142325794 [Lycorma delicatula]|uniref:uncharacterized protein LOC142325794 n=1 Tax=Lycorma delicatula TaxID=130591 RepID=UPI003F50F483
MAKGCAEIDQDTMIKTLGLMWNPRQDVFQFSFCDENTAAKTTKRTILSAIGRIFDPLGITGPVILTAKLIMQKLWSYSLGWDKRVPDELLKDWTQFQESFHMLSNIQVQRAIVPKQKGVLKLEIHGFADASESAYGACIYLKCIDLD